MCGDALVSFTSSYTGVLTDEVITPLSSERISMEVLLVLKRSLTPSKRPIRIPIIKVSRLLPIKLLTSQVNFFRNLINYNNT